MTLLLRESTDSLAVDKGEPRIIGGRLAAPRTEMRPSSMIDRAPAVADLALPADSSRLKQGLECDQTLTPERLGTRRLLGTRDASVSERGSAPVSRGDKADVDAGRSFLPVKRHGPTKL